MPHIVKNNPESPALQPRRVRPRVDVYESEHAHYVVLDVPGVAQDDVNIELDRGLLTIRALRRVSESEAVSYERAFNVPQGVERDAVQAQLKAGVLTVTLPKAAEAKPRRISVAAA